MTAHAFAPDISQRPPSNLQLGFLTPHNPYDRRNFSGTPYFAAKALLARPGLTTHILGHHPAGRFDRLLRRSAPPVDVDALDITGLDAVVGLVASPLLDRLADRHPDMPILHVTDATPAFLRDAYGWTVPAKDDAIETRLARQADVLVYSSEQIAARAGQDLGHPGLCPTTVPFGVNFDSLPERCPKKPALSKLNLLFVGIDWTRKGGDIAVDALRHLRASGLDATLTIVGRCPEEHQNTDGVIYAGFLNKNRPRDAARLTRLYRDAHLFVLPSRADCSPMVVAEAMAHGTPVLAADTGGIASLVGHGGAGRVLAQHTPPRDWAEAIRQMTGDRDAYAFMSDAGFDRAHQSLSWNNWAKQIETLARETVQARQVERGLKVASGG